MLFATGINWHDQFSQVPRTNRPDFTTFSIFSEVDCALRCTPCVRFNALSQWMSWSVTFTPDIASVFVYYLPCSAAAVTLQSLSMWKYFGFCAIVCLNACTAMQAMGTLTSTSLPWHRSIGRLNGERIFVFVFLFRFRRQIHTNCLALKSIPSKSLKSREIELETFDMFDAIESRRKLNQFKRWCTESCIGCGATIESCARFGRLRWHHFIHVDSGSVYGRKLGTQTTLIIRFKWERISCAKNIIQDIDFVSNCQHHLQRAHKHKAKLLTSFPDKLTWKEMCSDAHSLLSERRTAMRMLAKDCNRSITDVVVAQRKQCHLVPHHSPTCHCALSSIFSEIWARQWSH